MKTVPVFEAKNRFSELISAVEHGEQVSITRRGVRVARLVAEGPGGEVVEQHQRERVAAALASLRKIRGHLVLEGDIKSIAREGLD
jgi:prevent-host-death family protein